MLIIDDLLLWLPAKGLLGVFKAVQKAAEEEISSEGGLKKELIKIQMQYELGMITQSEFMRKEDEILKRLEALYKQRQAGRIHQ